VSIDTDSQIHISRQATATSVAVPLKFGGVFSNPTQIFEFDPQANSVASVPVPGSRLADAPAFITRMLLLPTGQVLFSDGSNQLWVYTPAADVPAGPRPVIRQIKHSKTGVFTIKGVRLNGQSAGSSYGDDVESDENYPIVRFTGCESAIGDEDTDGGEEPLCTADSSRVFYGRTTNWSTVDVATGSVRETVDFTLHSDMTSGWYLLEVIGAGVASAPFPIHITLAEAPGR
jgi:hypothetical protein